MADKSVVAVRRSFRRPESGDVAALSDVPTGWIADAQGRRGALTYAIRPITTATKATGVALTVRSRSQDNLAPYVALKYATAGDILVIQTDGFERAAVLGDVLLGMAKNAGVVAIVTDGLVRDIDGLNAVGIPVFARGLTPNSPFKDGPGEIGTSVSIGDVTVASGDVVVTDQDGVVVVPLEALADVRASLAGIFSKEAAMDAAVAAGQKFPAWVDDLVPAGKIRFLD